MLEKDQLFGVRERSVGATCVLELSGEVDILAASRTVGRLDALTSAHHPDLVLDLRAVTFIDCCGLSLLVRARRRVLERDGRLSVFVLHDDLVSALAAAPPGAAGGAIA